MLKDYLFTPIGLLEIKTRGQELIGVSVVRSGVFEESSDAFMIKVKKQIIEFFDGKRQVFDMAVAVTGTDFEQKVRKALLKVPYGQSVTYAELADSIQQPTAVRAAASAIASNPIGIIIPCHRVIPKSKPPGQYAWGAKAKQFLLDLESSSS
ncbi:MAG: methylated-DNA-[protein]-cysteine S-methyltransferase [Candidatus Omnitrophota bacterium]|jgi:methylated-DNA-[protein]-cysteine S-methyltransferase